MPSFPGAVASRLPKVGTTIFTVMSRLAAEHGAINLSQGYPDFSAPPELYDLVLGHMRAGRNQYAPMAGTPELRAAIAAKAEALHGTRYDVDAEVTVTAGGTQAIHAAITALVHPGDEVVILEPAYDSYAPAVELAGGAVVRLRLEPPHWRPDWSRLRAVIGPRTRLVVVNSPHNPTGAAFDAADLEALAAAVRGTGVAIVSDEVYEHILFDGRPHRSLSGHPELAARSLVVGSFGKTFHVTGWKVGWVLAPRELTAELRKVHQFVVFTVNTPVQLALAEWLRGEARWRGLPAFYQQKRDLFREGLARSRFRALPCAGTYFQLAAYDAVTDEPDTAFAERLTRQVGVAAIPVSAFYEAPPEGQRLVRFCFAKGAETLQAACQRLATV